MNRREFISNLAATAGVVVIGPVPTSLLEPVKLTPEMIISALSRAVDEVIADYQKNVLFYGVGLLQYTEEFPYVRSVDPADVFLT